MRPLFLLPCLLFLAACVGNVRQADTAIYDLGGAAPAPAHAVVGLAAVDVSAPSWLAGTAMQYRLRYADAARRQNYAASRWAAPPAELIEQLLDRRLASGQRGGCRLRFEVDELIQVFDMPGASHLILEGRASVMAGRERVAGRAFTYAVDTATADARGGVAAAAQAARRLVDELAAWLPTVSGACR